VQEANNMFLARLGGSFVLRTLANLSEVFEGDMMLGVVFIAIGQATVSHLSVERHLGEFDAQGIAPDDLRRAVSALSISASLNIPRETARRYVSRLVDLGYCQRVRGRRVIIPGDVYRRPDVQRALHSNRRDLQMVISAIRRADLLKDEPADDAD
jgi:hypothetical protein